MSLSSISIGLPGAQVICSTAALASSHLRRRDRLAVGTDDRRQAGVDAAGGPELARWHEDVTVHRHVGEEVAERDAGCADGFGGRPWLRFALNEIVQLLDRAAALCPIYDVALRRQTRTYLKIV